jgi:hypothetical protein
MTYVFGGIAVLLGALSSVSALAQETVPQIWADYHSSFYLSRDWQFYGDTGARYQWDEPKWASVYVRPSIRLHGVYKKPSELRAGLGVFYSHNEDISNTLEIRPWLGLLIKRPTIGPLTITNYVRLEERLVDTIDDSEWSNSTRLRYRIGLKIPISPDTREQYNFVPFSFEWFWDVGPGVEEVFADRLRVDVGFGRIFSYVWTAEFHMIFQEARQSQETTFSSEILIFRFQIKRLWSAHDYMNVE